jgi:protein-tyrosine-phosphatase
MILSLLLASLAQVSPSPTPAKSPKPVPAVVFVCEHGSVKSLIAKQWLQKLAAARGLEIRVLSRGISPDESVPGAIATNLAEDGVPADGFTPERFSRADLVGAVAVVAIGADVSAVVADTQVRIEQWNDIPPASTDYDAARTAIRNRLERLIETLPVRKGAASRKPQSR